MYAKLKTAILLFLLLLVAKTTVLDWSAAASTRYERSLLNSLHHCLPSDNKVVVVRFLCRYEWALRHSIWHGVVVLLAFLAHGAIWTSLNVPDHYSVELTYDFVSLPNEGGVTVVISITVMVGIAIGLTAATDRFLTGTGTSLSTVANRRQKLPVPQGGNLPGAGNAI
jgi:uncharacterized membrane protein YccC